MEEGREPRWWVWWGEEAFLERFLLLLLIIKKEGQMTFLFKFLAGLRGLEPRLTGPESVVLPIER